ncbi:hypothetical protein AB0M95_17980 [Sphaerisporangium sp. NPDC051017]|uniref:hypothetical protein n=1 Tax=Sphaerisporangium sp. NPDC051017 TaxID=3154636 RepID=UPI00342FEC3A
MDRAGISECLEMLAGQDAVRLRGVHAHLASGLDAPAMLELASAILDYARGLGVTEINLGGGMGVSYADPDARFDWKTYGEGLAALRQPGETLRIEPGRPLTVYCGRYVTRVIDVKRVHGELFAVVAGGTITFERQRPRGTVSLWSLKSRGSRPRSSVSLMNSPARR